MKSYEIVIYNFPDRGERRVLLSSMDINTAHSIAAGCNAKSRPLDYRYEVEEVPDKEK